MSIIITGLEMPTERESFNLTIKYNGLVFDTETMIQVAEAHEIPPHGDSIDRAALWVEINKVCDRRDAGIISDLTCLQQILSALRHAPTIIEADRGDDQ